MSLSPRGYNFFALEIMDELDHAYQPSDITSVTVLTANTRNTAATVYVDKLGNSALTNPVTSFTDGARVHFWGGATTYDLIVKLSNGACKRLNGVTSSLNRLVVDRWLLTVDGVPTVNASATGTITQYVYPQGDGSMIVELYETDVVIQTSQSATNAISYGGTTLTTFPSGEVNIIGIGGHGTMELDDDQSQYANDATPEGTSGFGTGVKNDAADVGDSDATDDDLLGTEDYVMAAYIDSAIAYEAAEGLTVDGTPSIVHNASIDASELTAAPQLHTNGWTTYRVVYRNAS